MKSPVLSAKAKFIVNKMSFWNSGTTFVCSTLGGSFTMTVDGKIIMEEKGAQKAFYWREALKEAYKHNLIDSDDVVIKLTELGYKYSGTIDNKE